MQLATATNRYAARGDSKVLRGSRGRSTPARCAPRWSKMLKVTLPTMLQRTIHAGEVCNLSAAEEPTPPGPPLCGLLRAFSPLRGLLCTFRALNGVLRRLWRLCAGF